MFAIGIDLDKLPSVSFSFKLFFYDAKWCLVAFIFSRSFRLATDSYTKIFIQTETNENYQNVMILRIHFIETSL